MSIKKTLLLAGMALAAIAFAVPAAASANGRIIDTATGSAIGAGAKIEFTGKAKFQTLGTGIECVVHATVESDSATTLTVNKFEITTTTCVGFGATFLNCVVLTDENKGLNWDVDVTTTDLDITDVTINATLEKCKGGVTFNNLAFATVTAKPINTAGTTAANKEGIAGIELSGTGTATTNKGVLSVAAEGTLEVAGTDSPKCTYAIESF